MKMFLRFSRWFFPLVGFIFYFQQLANSDDTVGSSFTIIHIACIETLAK